MGAYRWQRSDGIRACTGYLHRNGKRCQQLYAFPYSFHYTTCGSERNDFRNKYLLRRWHQWNSQCVCERWYRCLYLQLDAFRRNSCHSNGPGSKQLYSNGKRCQSVYAYAYHCPD
ncbi:UNKNOWN [Stylonychia lemnae]|uniref:Uncharacterized protein n=1 Tax=Stylonychia lemnae TaxID=5949 RepID=A0A077ZTH8_STYLE|nr:UNKNOWN [Stylonychia lemnae]|eukprot:CDW71766.1 UNKNOWN [Stylonychia lemnae]